MLWGHWALMEPGEGHGHRKDPVAVRMCISTPGQLGRPRLFLSCRKGSTISLCPSDPRDEDCPWSAALRGNSEH